MNGAPSEVCDGAEEEMAQRFQEACAFSDGLLAVFQKNCKGVASKADWLITASRFVASLRSCAWREWAKVCETVQDRESIDKSPALYLMPLLHYTLRLLSYPDISPIHKCWAAHAVGGISAALLEVYRGGSVSLLPSSEQMAHQMPSIMAMDSGQNRCGTWWVRPLFK